MSCWPLGSGRTCHTGGTPHVDMPDLQVMQGFNTAVVFFLISSTNHHQILGILDFRFQFFFGGPIYIYIYISICVYIYIGI